MEKKLYIFESELRAIAYEAAKYPNLETGGDLYGLWTADGNPVVYLATGPGKHVIHQEARYQMDIDYKKNCETVLSKEFGIHYLGDWHSHHKLEFCEPSSGDQNRIFSIFRKHINIKYMAEIIINHTTNGKGKEIISGYIYDRETMMYAEVVCPDSKTSPIRESVWKLKKKKLFNLIDGRLPINDIVLKEPKRTWIVCHKSRTTESAFIKKEPIVTTYRKGETSNGVVKESTKQTNV